MKTIKELLQLMLQHQDLFKYGLCHWNQMLLMHRFINADEYNLLQEYIDNNRPNKYESLNTFCNRNKRYYWSQQNIKPRINWINKHIKLN